MKKIPLHGGDLIAASDRYGIAVEEWVDLSTGLNPRPYPVGELSEEVFSALPYLRPEFLNTIESYYGRKDFLAIAGTQQIIQLLPECLPDFTLLVPQFGYREYADCWLRAGRRLDFYSSLCELEAQQAIDEMLAIDGARHLLLINPNNPTGLKFSAQKVLSWAGRLNTGAYLVVDEAFMDVTPEQSVLAGELPNNIIVLRSFGKFFGLAGIRLGVVFAHQSMLERFSRGCGLWHVNGPAQAIALKAFADLAWQKKNRQWLEQSNTLTQSVFAPLFDLCALRTMTATLFFSVVLEKNNALRVYEFFASHGLLLRLHLLDNDTSLLRVGLIDSANHLQLVRVRGLVEQCRKACAGGWDDSDSANELVV